MGLGGPVWHASASARRAGVTEADLVAACYALLDGYGDAGLGEWTEMPGRIFHLRRRLSEAEASLVGPVVDVRGTPEAARRVAPVRRLLAAGGMESIMAEELTGR